MLKNKKKLQKIESKERLLNVASRLFKKNGYSATGIDQIMLEAGLTAGAFYAHFKSKADLLDQCIEHSFQYTFQHLFKDTAQLRGEEKIQTILNRYVSKSHRDLPEKGCILPALAAELYRGSKKSKEIINQYLNKWAEILGSEFSEPISAEEKKQKALKLISQAVGVILLSRMVKETELSNSLINSARS